MEGEKKNKGQKIVNRQVKKLYWLATGTTQGVVRLANLTGNGELRSLGTLVSNTVC